MAVPRVLHIIDGLSQGGAERMAVQIAAATPPDRYKASICVTRPVRGLEKHLEGSVEVMFLDRSRRFDLREFRRLDDTVRTKNVDILHVHGRSSWMLVAFMRTIGLVRRPALVFHDHYGRIEIDPKLPIAMRTTLRLLRPAYVAVHPAMLDALGSVEGRSLGTFLIPNGIDFAAFGIESSSMSRERMEGPIGVLVANLHSTKRIEAAIRCAARLRDQPWKLRLIGSARGAYAQRCVRSIAELGLDGRVELLGARDDIPAILRAADFGLLCSASESGPLALLEYAAAGLPFVSTRVGSIGRSLARAGVPGFVEAGDDDALVGAVAELLALGLDERAARGRVGREAAAREFDLRVQMDKLLSVYEVALGRS